MKYKMRLSIGFWFSCLTVLLLAGFSCKNGNSTLDNDGESIDNKVVINLDDKKQTIRNFGASDAWACQFVGNWPDQKRNQMADWLFSKEVDETGKPKGIGLSMWRFNIGAGSATQNNISDEWRRTESFLIGENKYDWTKQSGQQWFLQAAKQRGVENFLAFTNSPPIQYTKNGKAFSSNGEEANIGADRYLDFSKFLVDVLKEFKQKGMSFNYISPFNEPQWDWTGNGQEGTPFRNTEIFAVTKILDSLLTKNELATKIQIAEAGKLNYLYEKADKPTRGDQVVSFFNNASSLYLGDRPNVDRMISGHSYFTTAMVDIKNVREKVASKLRDASVPLEFWQSEYCILGDQEEVKGPGKDVSIVPALYVARILHNDLTVANASAWHWWLSITAYDYKDGLIYVDKNKTDGNFEDTKLLWALGNYSRFIKPGAVRVGVSAQNFNADNAKGIMMSSYLNPETNELVIVAINYGDADTSTFVGIAGGSVASFQGYLTGPGSDEKLKPTSQLASDQKITIPKKSILTLVGKLK